MQNQVVDLFGRLVLDLDNYIVIMEILYSDLNGLKLSNRKPHSLGSRLIKWCNANKINKGHILIKLDQSFDNGAFGDLLEKISTRLSPEIKSVLRSDYEIKLKKSFAALGAAKNTGYLFITASHPAGPVFLPDHLAYVKTSTPDVNGKEYVIEPKLPTDKVTVIKCLLGFNANDLRKYDILLEDNEAVIKSPIMEKSKKFYFDILSDLKDQLFDAPSDVKNSFNQVVKYFGNVRSTNDLINEEKPTYHYSLPSNKFEKELSGLGINRNYSAERLTVLVFKTNAGTLNLIPYKETTGDWFYVDKKFDAIQLNKSQSEKFVESHKSIKL